MRKVFIKDIGKKAYVTVKENFFGMMVLFMKVIEKKINNMVSEEKFMLMELFIKENGKKVSVLVIKMLWNCLISVKN